MSRPTSEHSGAEDFETNDLEGAEQFERDNTYPDDPPDPSEYME